MKKKLLFVAAAAVMGIFASCTKDTEDVMHDELSSAEGSVVSITFSSESISSRSFFSSTAGAEDWEKALSSVSIFTFDTNGDLIVRREFDKTEIGVQKSVFALPGVASGDECEFYVIANTVLGQSVITKELLYEQLEQNLTSHNGTFAQVSGASLRDDGFVMSGSSTQTAKDGAISVDVTLKRTVAKVAVQASLSSDFKNLYSGNVRVNNITVSGGASQSRIVSSDALTGTMNFSHTQNSSLSGSDYQNLFYLYENDATSEKITLTMDATYDRDGDYTSEDDQLPVEYVLELDGSGDGEIIRNGYYRIAITMNGLTGADATVNITVADWESVADQNVNLGN